MGLISSMISRRVDLGRRYLGQESKVSVDKDGHPHVERGFMRQLHALNVSLFGAIKNGFKEGNMPIINRDGFWNLHKDGGILAFNKASSVNGIDLVKAREAWQYEQNVYMIIYILLFLCAVTALVLGEGLSAVSLIVLFMVFLLLSLRASWRVWQINERRFGSIFEFIFGTQSAKVTGDPVPLEELVSEEFKTGDDAK